MQGSHHKKEQYEEESVMKGSDISETSRFISALNIFLSCVVARCLSLKFQKMPVSGLVSQGGQNIGLEASCQYGQIFEMAEHRGAFFV